LEWNERDQAYKVNEELGILVQVTVSKLVFGTVLDLVLIVGPLS
jgi:hypothetical protein